MFSLDSIENITLWFYSQLIIWTSKTADRKCLFQQFVVPKKKKKDIIKMNACLNLILLWSRTVDYWNLPLPPRTSTSTVKFFCSVSPVAMTVYFPACFLLDRAGRTTTCPSLYQVTNGWGFPLTSQLRLSPSLTRTFVGQTSCGPTERKEKSPPLKLIIKKSQKIYSFNIVIFISQRTVAGNFSDVTTGGCRGPLGPSSSLVSHQYWTPSSSLLGVMLKVKVSVTGLLFFFLLWDCSVPSGICPL